MDTNFGNNMIDVNYATDISNRMQVPSRLSLRMPEFSSADNVSSRVLISGSSATNPFYDPYDFPASRPSLEAPPESLVLGEVEYPAVDHLAESHYPHIDRSKENSNLSLFHTPYGPADDDRTLVEHDPLNVSAEGCVTSPAVNIEDRLDELVSRVATLEEALARQNRREIFVFILLGTYFLLKLGRSLL